MMTIRALCFLGRFVLSIVLAIGVVAPAKGDESTFAAFDRRVERLMADHSIPGFSLAVTDQGRLVYAKAYGLADRDTETPVTSDSLFRIASISKPITAVAILQLVEQQRLSLDDRVFNILDFEAEITKLESFDDRLHEVTIRQLLQHRGGWDRNESFDPMFQSVRFANELGVSPPAEPVHVIRAMLRQRLDFDPGAKYAYSNFGYCLLGRVIEKVSGESYETYVKQKVLAPLGIRSMRIGRTRLSERLPLEVRYYDPARRKSVFANDLGETVPAPYGAWYLEAMDAHGGWLATATDLARFAVAFDHGSKCPVLSRKSIETMFAPVAAERERATRAGEFFYSLGWSNRVHGQGKVNHWHSGSLPGTTATLICRHDGRNFVALLNTRHTKREQSIHAVLDRMLHKAANEIGDWPEHDLFQGQ